MQYYYYNKAEYVEMASGTKVSKRALLCGSQNIVLHEKVLVQSDAIIRGDLADVKIGRYCIISNNAVIRPPLKKFNRGPNFAYFPLTMGNHVIVGQCAIVNAELVGSYVNIGKNAIIGRGSVLKDCCNIMNDAVVLPETIVPSFTFYLGNPARCIEKLSESTVDMDNMIAFTKNYYEHFLPLPV